MRLIDHFCDLALRQFGTSNPTVLLELFHDPSFDRGKRLLAEFHLACRRAWLALELALGGPSLAAQLATCFSGVPHVRFAAEVQMFLQAFPLQELRNKTYFRQQCLEELRQARRQGLLTAERLTGEELQQKGHEWLSEGRPPGMLRVEWRAQDGIAGELEQGGLQSLPWLLRQRPEGRPPLLLSAMRYFFRCMVEEDTELGHSLLLVHEEDVDPTRAEGLRLLHEVLRTYAPRIEAFLDAIGPALASDALQASGEVPFNAYRDALKNRRYGDALEHLQQALSADAERFAPFPLDDYEPVQIVRAGRFAATFLCRAKALGGRVAIESLTLRAFDLRIVAAAFRDAIILHQLHHPGIIRLHRWGYVDPEKTRPYIVMEPFAGQTLQEHVEEHGPLSFAELKELARQLAEALRSAHRRGILHRAIEPANVLLRRPEKEDSGLWEVRIVNFGLALEQGEAARGTPGADALQYAAPEQLGKLPGVEAGPATDVYGFARTCCYALFQSANPLPEQWQKLSPSLVDLLHDCLEERPENRLADLDAVLERLARVQAGRHHAKRSGQVVSPPRLIVLRGLKLHVEYFLHDGTNMIGRDARGAGLDVDLEDQEPDGSVLSSRRHALIAWKGGRLSVTDLASANGTYVNRVRVDPGDEYPLHDQDVSQIGSVVLQVAIDF